MLLRLFRQLLRAVILPADLFHHCFLYLHRFFRSTASIRRLSLTANLIRGLACGELLGGSLTKARSVKPPYLGHMSSFLDRLGST